MIEPKGAVPKKNRKWVGSQPNKIVAGRYLIMTKLKKKKRILMMTNKVLCIFLPPFLQIIKALSEKCRFVRISVYH